MKQKIALDKLFDRIMLSTFISEVILKIIDFFLNMYMNPSQENLVWYDYTAKKFYLIIFIIVYLIVRAIAKKNGFYNEGLSTLKILKWFKNVSLLATYGTLILFTFVSGISIYYLLQNWSSNSINYSIYTLQDIPFEIIALYCLWLMAWLLYLLMNTRPGSVIMALMTITLDLKIIYDVFDIGVIFDPEASLTDSLAADIFSLAVGDSDLIMAMMDLESATDWVITIIIFIAAILLWITAQKAIDLNGTGTNKYLPKVLKIMGIIAIVCLLLAKFLPVIPGAVTKLLIVLFHGVS